MAFKIVPDLVPIPELSLKPLKLNESANIPALAEGDQYHSGYVERDFVQNSWGIWICIYWVFLKEVSRYNESIKGQARYQDLLRNSINIPFFVGNGKPVKGFKQRNDLIWLAF